MLSYEDELAAQVGLSDHLGSRVLEAFESGDADTFWNATGAYEETKARIGAIEYGHDSSLSAFAKDRPVIELVKGYEMDRIMGEPSEFAPPLRPVLKASLGATAMFRTGLSGELGIKTIESGS